MYNTHVTRSAFGSSADEVGGGDRFEITNSWYGYAVASEIYGDTDRHLQELPHAEVSISGYTGYRTITICKHWHWRLIAAPAAPFVGVDAQTYLDHIRRYRVQEVGPLGESALDYSSWKFQHDICVDEFLHLLIC